MKICSWLLCLGMVSSLQASLRNPFIMPLPRCEETLKQLDSWHLKGVIGSSSGYVALMAPPQRPMLRVGVDTELMAEVKIVAVTIDTVSASLDGICDGANYHWYLSGGKNDKENNRRIVTIVPAQHPREPTRDADAG